MPPTSFTNPVQKITRGKNTYELLWISCGKKNCGKCPHGPYWYLIVTLNTGRKVKRYLGKEAPADLADFIGREGEFEIPDDTPKTHDYVMNEPLGESQ